MTNDMINGLFELVGSLFTLTNCFALWKDESVKGINPFATFYFTCWGLWNCFWYPTLNQPFSFYGGLAITVGNFTWVGLLLFFKFKSKALPK